MSADKYPSIFSRQMEAIVYLEYSRCRSRTKCNVLIVFSAVLKESLDVNK